MKMTIEMTKFSTYISSGRISNVFKILNLKDIKFEETKLLFSQKNYLKNDLLTHAQIIDFAKIKIQELHDKRKYDNEYSFNHLIDNNLDKYINTLNIDNLSYFHNFLKEKYSILENKLVQEKLHKLKKIKELNL